jgi:hypothetical protein
VEAGKEKQAHKGFQSNLEIFERRNKGVSLMPNSMTMKKNTNTFVLVSKLGQQIWDTRAVKPGVYFYTLNAGGFSKHGKIVISK